MPRKNYFRTALKNLDEIVFVIEYPDMTYRYISPAIKATGVTPEEVYADPNVLLRMMDEAELQTCLQQIEEHIGQGTLHFEYPLTIPSGEEKWYSTSVYMVDDASDKKLLAGMSRDITHQKKSEIALEKRIAAYEDLYNNAPNGYHALDANDVLTQVNDTALTWLGYTREELLGKPWPEAVMTPESRKAFQSNIPALKEQGYWKGLQLELVRKDGSILPCLVNTTTVKDEAGQSVRMHSVLTDIGELKQVEKKLQQSQLKLEVANQELMQTNQKLEQLNATKDVLLRTVSHDLRTPLEAINMVSALLHERYTDLDTDTVMKYLRHINETSSQASNILEDVAALVGLSNDDIRLHFQVCDVAPIIEEAIRINMGSASEKNIQLLYAPHSLMKVNVDAKWLVRALDNIVYNAIKFSNKGDIVKIGCHSIGGKVILTVADNGIGIPDALIPKLFKEFAVQSRPGTSGEIGTGLGLSVVKQIIDMQLGEVSVKSTEEVGSIFDIRLPMAS